MSNRQTSRQGFTLFELITAVAASGALVIGMSSTVFIALRAVDTSTTPATDTLTGLNVLSELAGELQFAQAVFPESTKSLYAAVPDRDGDNLSEPIGYVWSGDPGTPLFRHYKSESAVSVVSDVHNFVIDYHQQASDIEYVNIRIQITSDPRTTVETAIPLLNRP